MRAIIQRVQKASVRFERDGESVKNEIGYGVQVLLGITHEDDSQDLAYVIDKIIGLRIFEDEQGKMNRSIQDVNGEILIVSQFTLYGDARKGRRPSFTEAARPEYAIPLYNKAIDMIRDAGIVCKSGEFGADMLVEIHNDGPVTILLDSTKIL